MLDFIVDNYLIIMIVVAFILFAIIGYVVDVTKNQKTKTDVNFTPDGYQKEEEVNEEEGLDDVIEETDTSDLEIEIPAEVVPEANVVSKEAPLETEDITLNIEEDNK